MQLFFYPTEKNTTPLDAELSSQLNNLISYWGSNAVKSAVEQALYLEDTSEYLLQFQVSGLINYYGKSRMRSVASIHFPTIAA